MKVQPVAERLGVLFLRVVSTLCGEFLPSQLDVAIVRVAGLVVRASF